jgi:hypothetical protein
VPSCNQRHRFGCAQCPDCHSYAASKSSAEAKMTAPKTPAARRAYKKIAGQSSETAARSNGATGGRPGATVRHQSIAASRDTVLIALHRLQPKTRSAVLIEIAGSLPMQFIGKPHPPQLGGGAVGGG